MQPSTNNKRWLWIGVAAIAALAVWAYLHYDLGRLLSLEQLKAQQSNFAALYERSPLVVIGAYALLYIVVFALALPVGAVMTLAGGALFGIAVGTIVVSFASSVGALLAFLAARHVLADSVRARFGARLNEVDKGMERDGAFYLFTLRLIPAVPPAAINLLFGLTKMRAWTFYWVSQLGMLAGTIVYVNAGTQLARIDSVRGVLSPGLIASFVLLGAFPLAAKKAIDVWKARRIYARWSQQRPKTFDRNLIVIGAGAGGLVSAYIAAVVKAKVTLVEGHKMGGDCLNYGCVPSKALIRSAKLMHQLKHKAASLGIDGARGEVNFAAVMARIKGVIRDIEPHDSVERYTGLGVDVVQGHARITSPWSVELTPADGGAKSTLTTRSIVIAAGAEPFVPPIPGLKESGCLTSDTVWDLTELPRRLVVLGGGPIGCELAQAFARLGSQVTQVEMLPRVMVREDPEVSDLVAASLRADGITLLTGHQAVRCESSPKRLVVKQGEQESAIEFDVLLCAVGRSPRVTGYGLEELGIPITNKKTIDTNAWLQTLYPNIYAVGDVAGPYQFTHTAAHQAWYAAVNALFGRFKKFKADYSVIPWATFTDPEVARVGLSESEAKEQNVAYEVTRYGIDDLDRAIADGTAQGFVKVLTVPGKDKILGATIVGEHAGDLLAEFVLAMKHGLGLNKILGTIHTYPTLAEANKYAAGEWKRAHAPKKLLDWVRRYHDWERA
jgi:pyruvate/2-oxoglutarate dehydrogenase complex dihydrolipoamide dehydrogenase (E3) component/uncharacterized membrane protein YdjX (TVP38/TMEM64 family)